MRLSYAWDYNLNVLKIIEENAYYPFGLKHSGHNNNLEAHKAVANETKVELKTIPGGGVTVEVAQSQYKFNGKEYQSELALNLYDMDMRDYDPAIGRWLAIDPVTHFSQSPYNAFDGNPVFWADPSGADAYTDMWNSNQSYLSSSLGSSWGNTGGTGGFTHDNMIHEENNGTLLDIDMSLFGNGVTFFNFNNGVIVGGGYIKQKSTVESVGPIIEGDGMVSGFLKGAGNSIIESLVTYSPILSYTQQIGQLIDPSFQVIPTMEVNPLEENSALAGAIIFGLLEPGPGGEAKAIGKIAKYEKLADSFGTRAFIKEFNNTSIINTRILFNDITQGGIKRIINTEKGKIINATMQDGSIIQLRNFSTNSGTLNHSTIEFIGNQNKWKFNY